MKRAFKGLVLSLTTVSIVSVTACSGSTESGAPKNNTTSTSPSSLPPAEGVQEHNFKMAVELNEEHPQGKGVKKFAELVEEKSGGKIKLNLYYNSQLGDAKKMIDQLKTGLLDLSVIDPANLTGDIPEMGIFGFPFIFNNEKEVDAVLDGPLGDRMLEKLPDIQLIGLSYWENGFRNITNTKHPIKTMEDFAGLKIRTMQNSIHIDAFNTIGANPTPMAFSELFTALESKTVDGQENPLLIIEQSKFYEVQDYLTLSNHVYSPFILLVSKKTWDQLSDEEKNILKDTGIEAAKYNREVSREDNKKTLESLQSKGMKVNELSTEEKEKIQEKIKPVIDKYTAEFGDDLVNQLFGEIEKSRK